MKVTIFAILILFFFCKGQTTKSVYERIHEGNFWGFVDAEGNDIIPTGIYEFLNPIDEENMILAKKNGKDGYIDIHQNIIIPFEYEDLGVFTENGLAPAKKNGKSGAINRKGEVAVDFIYDDLEYFYNSGLAIVSKNGKQGFVDSNGNEVIPLIYEDADQTMTDDVVILLKNKKWAFFSNEGIQLTDFKYDKIKDAYIKKNDRLVDSYFKGGLVVVEKDSQISLLDRNLQEVVPFGKYDEAQAMNINGYGIISKNGKYGIIDRNGNEIVPVENDTIMHPQSYSNILELFIIKRSNRYQVFDENAKPITANNLIYFEWDKIDVGSDFIDVLILKNDQNKTGIIDEKGNIVLPFEFEEIRPFGGNENTIAKKEGKYGIINFKNQKLTPFESEELYLNSKLYVVKQQGKFGLLDKSGNKILDFVFDDLQPCYYDYENRFIVKSKGKYGIVSLSGKEIIPVEYDEISNWVEYGPDAHFVTKNNKKGMISREGKQLLPATYDELDYLNDSYIIVSQNKKFGIVNIHNIEYENVYVDWYEVFYERKKPEIYVKKNKKYYQINEANKIIKENVPESFIKEKFFN